MTPTQKAALLALAEAGEVPERAPVEAGLGFLPGSLWDLWGTGWAARHTDGMVRLTPAGRGAVEALRAGARVETEPTQRALPLGQRRLL